ncbi:hypothetical protein ABMA28_002531 [Loxostege sticticalis]|uniref:non-specific serine/threonine protein kinase n=1 Tax=Loxostege sticticalis TaxID=481309 RepID=A0ABD0SX55_LOXSC
MRRTYRSKKETEGALDHKDVLQTLDEKSSVFDAFYIQNIKQTKRELSCIGSSNHYGTAASKVRKRKYVKRIIKDSEPPARESLTMSAFLTPDKSLRVNKVQDLFDQLLNSSSTRQTESPSIGRSNIIKYRDRPESKKYYGKRKLAKIKKFNCSSSDSLGSDKENSNEDCETSNNVTDLKSFELMIETETKPSPKHLDASINNIVNNISILNKIDQNRDNSVRSSSKPYNYAKNRLTTNLQSPTNSPLCSTPFKEKYRSQSIYKFSPIAFGKNDESPNYVTIEEEKDDSVVLVDKDETPSTSQNEEYQPSPIIHLSVNRTKRSSKNKTCSTTSSEHSESPQTPNVVENKEEITNIVDITSIEISDFQTTEAEPFYGFSNEPVEVHSIENDNESFADGEAVELRSIENENESLANVESAVDAVQNDLNEKSIVYDEISQPSQDETNDDDSSSEDDENESSYGTCNSDQSYQDNVVKVSKVPVVKIERLNDSVLQKFYEKMISNNYQDESEESSELESDDYASIEDIQSDINESDGLVNDDLENEMQTEVDASINVSDRLTDSLPNDDSNNEHKRLSSNNEDDRCISFVTTRRRNEVANDSLIYDFNNSFGSASTTDCDKTVISNNDKSERISLGSNLEKCTDSINAEKEIGGKLSKNEEENPKDILERSEDKGNDNVRFSSVTTRKSSRLPRESDIDEDVRRTLIENEGKPAIVLQPGKKWERSLSIYKRMTMMEHLDHSILDDDELLSKGRKYRQSVISTMELQDFKGSLHNESIISRRSTFVSKPCRSTIRIIKEPNTSRPSLCTTSVSDDSEGYLHEDCDDTIIELSKLSIAESENEVTVIENFHDTSNRVTTAREYVLRRCNQTDAILFDECYPETVLKNCRKIGEGVYGEVFLWRAGDGRVRVMKIVPIAGTTKVNGERQKDFQEIISEIVIAMELSALRAPIDEIQREFDAGKEIDSLDLHSVENATDVFNEVLAVRCVYGGYPSRLLDLWELYDECNGSENDNPAILPADQQYIVLELANAGQDLESFEFNSAEQAHALFLQIAFGLAVGEEAFQFEHRDLHWGNVLIAPTDQKFATFVLRGRAHRVPRCGVAGTIIDYSLSRLSLALAGGERAALYNDLAADDSLFDAVGDYQFAVYRHMRDKLGNDWKNFEPYTNILWLHYTVDKMITALRYKRTNTKIHKHYIAKLKGIKNRILDYGSAAQFVLTDNEF